MTTKRKLGFIYLCVIASVMIAFTSDTTRMKQGGTRGDIARGGLYAIVIGGAIGCVMKKNESVNPDKPKVRKKFDY